MNCSNNGKRAGRGAEETDGQAGAKMIDVLEKAQNHIVPLWCHTLS